MENKERERILKIREIDVRLKRLYEEHERFELQLGLYGRRAFLTPQEQQKQKELKFKKLKGVEKMLSIVKEHQDAA